MQIRSIRTVEDWAVWAESWKALLAESHQQNPFLSYEFQQAWWQHGGGGEWPQAELQILLGLDEDETLLGIAPFFTAPGAEGERTLMPIGSHEIADFLDLIVRLEHHAAFVEALLDYLAGPEAPEFERLDFFNLLSDSQTGPILETQGAAHGWAVERTRLQASPYVPLPDSFETYLDSLAGGDAREMRRKLRRASRYAVPIGMEVVTGGEALDQAMEDFFALMGQEAEKAAFLTPTMQTQMEAIARATAEGGWLQLAFLKVGHTRAAAYLNFDYQNRIWAYNAGFANDFAELSPGWLLAAQMMDWAIQHGREAFDFMRGDEDYKYRFGGVDRYVEKISLTPKQEGTP